MMYNTLTGILGALCLWGLSGMQFLDVDPEHLTYLCVNIHSIDFNCLFGKFAAVMRHDVCFSGFDSERLIA